MAHHLENMTPNDAYARRMHLFFSALCLAAVFQFLHYAAMVYKLYWVFWWFDILMHFIGGLVIGVFALLLLKKAQELYIIPIALLVVITWEWFEVYIVKIPIWNPTNYAIDTVTDIIWGSVGFYVAYKVVQAQGVAILPGQQSD